MTAAECEIVANAGVQLREIAERLTLPPSFRPESLQGVDLSRMMDAAALSISEVYGQLSALPLEVEDEAPARDLRDVTIVAVRREIEDKARAEGQGSVRMMDIATTRLAWCLQQFPEVADAYDRAWRKSA